MLFITTKAPLSWKQVRDEEIQHVRGVCFDIDETFSTRGKITSEAYRALWELKNAGFRTVPLTGRPAGWCDHIARFWPVDAVVGENGAFTFHMEHGKRGRLDTNPARDAEKLLKLKAAIEKSFPGVCFASDQAYRETDLAIDFCEDVEPWNPKDVERLVRFCKDSGAEAKVSSIHVNAWFGDHDKWKGFLYWLKHGLREAFKPEEWIFIGDSPNDEPLFRQFPQSVAVANIRDFLGQIKAMPRWITEKESGAGFVELAQTLCALARQ